MALAHLVNDSYAYMFPALLPLLLGKLGLTLGLAGLLVTIYQASSSFTQPLFGHLADRGASTRWMAWTGVALSGLSAGSLGVLGSFPLLAVALLAGGLGTALYHPVSAALVAQAVPQQRRGRWMSLYISAGNFGLPTGTLVLGLVLATVGLGGTPIVVAPALAIALLVVLIGPRATTTHPAQTGLRAIFRANRRMLSGLVSVSATRAWATSLVSAFLPVYAVSRGADPVGASVFLTVFLLAGACGGLVGGELADRLGRDRVIVASIALAAPSCVVLALQHEIGPLFWLASTASGLCLNGSFVVLAVRGQESLPGSLGMVSGVMLGLSIGLGGLAVAPMAAVAERTGLESVLYAAAALALASAFLVTRLPAPPARVGETIGPTVAAAE